MSRLLLVVFIGALLVTALLLLALIVGDGRLGEMAERLLLASTATAMAASLGMAGTASLRVPGLRALGMLTLAPCGVAYVLVMATVLGARPSEGLGRATWTLVALSGGAGLASALLFIRLLEQWRVIRVCTLFALACLVAGVIAIIVGDPRGTPALGQFTGVAGVLFVVGVVLLLIGRDQSRKAFIKEEGRMTVLRCPHCGEALPTDLAEVFH